MFKNQILYMKLKIILIFVYRDIIDLNKISSDFKIININNVKEEEKEEVEAEFHRYKL